MLSQLKGAMDLLIHDLVVAFIDNLLLNLLNKRASVLPFSAVLTADTQGAAIFVE